MLLRTTSWQANWKNAGRHRRPLTCHASIHARWCFDARYGSKQECTALLQEWVQTVGKSAGLSAENTRLSSGALGVPESRLEMEVTFDNMADWEAFLSRIPFQEHRAWTQRIASMVVDGSPVWQVHRSVPVLPHATSEEQLTRARTAPAAQTSNSSSPGKQLIVTDQIGVEDMAAWQQLKSSSSSSSSSPTPPSTPSNGQPAAPTSPPGSEAGERVQLDWKGEPIKFNPGDKLPFKFL